MRRVGLLVLLFGLLCTTVPTAAEPAAPESTPGLVAIVLEIIADLLPDGEATDEEPPIPEIMGGVDPSG